MDTGEKEFKSLFVPTKKEDACLICFNNVNIVSKCCGIHVHQDCIVKWWKISRKCPHCQKDMLTEDVWKKNYKDTGISVSDSEEIFQRGFNFGLSTFPLICNSPETLNLLSRIFNGGTQNSDRIVNELAQRAARSLYTVLGEAINQCCSDYSSTKSDI